MQREKFAPISRLLGRLPPFSKERRKDGAPPVSYTHLLDDNLIEEARRVGRHKTKKDAVTAALAEYVQRRKQLRILKAFGSFDFDPKYDYKAERRRKRS